MQDQRREKNWEMRAAYPKDGEKKAVRLAEEIGVSPMFAKILVLRGYDSAEKARVFFGKEDTSFYDPFLLSDMKAAVDRILSAIEHREKIAVFGDYDADGVTSVALFYDYLSQKGADATYYIPNRVGEGYGLSKASLEQLASDGITLIVTVDNGITAAEEVAFAATLGIDTVVTDHHECPEVLPDAVAVVNPHRAGDLYPFKDLAGVGVIFKVICACELSLARRSGTREDASVLQRISGDYLDLVALGSVADVMPLVDENRLIVAYGIELLKKTKRPGLLALMRAISGDRPKKINSTFIGFQLAPRINAAGRIDRAERALELLLSKDDEEAERLAADLCDLNQQRHAEENRMVEQAYRKIEALPPEEREYVIVLEDDAWHQGVIGIVASNITERYGLPAILISFDGASRGYPAGDDLGKGSGRSVKGVNLAQALSACSDLLVKCGGHELAAGLTIRRRDVSAFRKAINDYAKESLSGKVPEGSVEYDCEASAKDLTLRLAGELSSMEPFGQGNPEPLLRLDDVTILSVSPIGDGKHARLLLEKDGLNWAAVKFGTPPSKLPVAPGELSDLLFHLSLNEFNGRTSLQLRIEELRPAESLVKEQKKLSERYFEILSGSPFSTDEELLPTREDFALVYKTLRMECQEKDALFPIRRMLRLFGGSVGYIKLKVILSVLEELGLCRLTEPIPDTFLLEFEVTPQKTDLSNSQILARLESKIKD